MMEQLILWWRARTGREQRLLQGASVIAFAFVLAWSYLGAAAFRDEAAARLANARRIETQVAHIAEASPAGAAAGETSLRARALAAAQASGLTPARVDGDSGDRVRIAFEPADSLAVYRWIDAVGRSGAYVTRSSIVRIENSDLVGAEFVVAGSP